MDTFVGDTVTIVLNTETDLTVFDTLEMKYRKPDLTTGIWTATQCPIVDEHMKYTCSGNDLDIAGDWAVQARVITIGGNVFHGKWAHFRVHEPIYTVATTTLAPTTTI